MINKMIEDIPYRTLGRMIKNNLIKYNNYIDYFFGYIFEKLLWINLYINYI